MQLSNASTVVGTPQRFSVGERVHLVSWIHNVSNLERMNGDIAYTVYLSTNDTITTIDTPIASFRMRNISIGPKETVVDTRRSRFRAGRKASRRSTRCTSASS